MSSAGLDLFARVPSSLFQALGGTQPRTRTLYWFLINDLYEALFGPDASDAEGGEAAKSKVLARAKEFMALHPELWEETETDPAIIAANHLRYLIDTGWFTASRKGTIQMLHMRPEVSGLLAMLRQFAEEGPTDVGGEVQVIYSTLKSVKEDTKSNASSYAPAAKLALGLFSKLSATTLRARDLLKEINALDSMPEYLDAFFKSYITDLYIADYGALKTKNHPLRHRYEIIDIVESLWEDDEAREAIEAHYRKRYKDPELAERLFDRDTQRLRRFNDVDRYLARLDESISTTIGRATAQIHYRLRNQDPIEPALDHLIESIQDADAAGVPLTIEGTAGRLLSTELLRSPVAPKPRATGAALSRRRMTPRERAFKELMKLKDLARQIDVRRTQAYLHLMTASGSATSDALKIKKPNDLIIFLMLLRVSALSAHPDMAEHFPNSVRAALRGFTVRRVPERWTDNEYLRAQQFEIERNET